MLKSLAKISNVFDDIKWYVVYTLFIGCPASPCTNAVCNSSLLEFSSNDESHWNVNSFYPLTIFAKPFIIDVLQDSEYASESTSIPSSQSIKKVPRRGHERKWQFNFLIIISISQWKTERNRRRIQLLKGSEYKRIAIDNKCIKL